MSYGYKPQIISTIVDGEIQVLILSGYKPQIISTIVDMEEQNENARGYKPQIISTIVDCIDGRYISQIGYKPQIISTIVDGGILSSAHPPAISLI